jgi:rhodanese-related sulfurtransferase
MPRPDVSDDEGSDQDYDGSSDDDSNLPLPTYSDVPDFGTDKYGRTTLYSTTLIPKIPEPKRKWFYKEPEPLPEYNDPPTTGSASTSTTTTTTVVKQPRSKNANANAANAAAGAPTSATPTGSPNPIFTMSQLSLISSSCAPTISPSNAFELLTSTNLNNKNMNIYKTETYAIDVRPQCDVFNHIVGGKSNTLVRGAIPFSVDVIKKIEKASEDDDEKRLRMLPEGLREDEDCFFKTILVTCTDGNLSHLVCDSLMEIGFANAIVVEGGIRAWAEKGLPVVSFGGADMDLSDDDDDEDWVKDKEDEEKGLLGLLAEKERTGESIGGAAGGKPPLPPSVSKAAEKALIAADISSDEGSDDEEDGEGKELEESADDGTSDAIDMLFKKGMKLAMGEKVGLNKNAATTAS